MPPNVLVLDVGGSFLKLARVEVDTSSILQFSREPMPQPVSDSDGRVSYNIGSLQPLMSRALDGLRALRDDHSVAVAVTGQMHGVALSGWDSSDAEVVCWRDALRCRTAGSEARASDQVGDLIGADTRVRLGNELREGIPISTLTARRTRGELQFGRFRSLPALFVEGLTGQWCGSVHTTDAAASGLTDVANAVWAQDVLEILSLDGIELPEITPGPITVGTFDGLPVMAPLGDHQAALLGSQLPSSAVSLNIATGGQVSAISDAEHGPWQVRPYFDGRFIRTVTHIPSGRAINALLALLFEGDSDPVNAGWEWITTHAEDLIAGNPETVGVCPSFFPSVIGEFGSLTSLSERNMNRTSVIASCASAIVDLFHGYVESIGEGLNFGEVIVTGGLGTRSELFRSLVHRRFVGNSLRFVDEDDAAVLGAARFAWNGVKA